MEVVCNNATTVVLGWDSMGFCALLVLINVILSVVLHLGLTSKLIVAMLRCTIQLTVLGYILEPIFKENEVYAVLPICYILVLLAIRESFARPKYSYGARMFVDITIAMATTTTAVMAYATFVVLRQNPWYDAQYMIPLVGMLLGNILNGITLGLDRCLKEYSEGRRTIELYLAAGATKWEATRPLIQEAMRGGMMPTLNGMNVIGLVSIPGMMTGQILGGAAPQQAARYQIFIMFMIAANVALGLIIAVLLSVTAVFDHHHRLLSRKVTKRKGSAGDIVTSVFTAVKDFFVRCCARKSGYEEIK
eukprot:comp21322_c0_seq1/m.29196 comp21322_c0_seq1/g.29196  ORF comp21322_c0_seq1/g.29196 comp21322_c0_seq1/m.29196 type:complete len:305 (-) comp21322_c0_seq1:24-938(-)